MVTYFNITDLRKFGTFLLSDERREYYKKHPSPVKLSLDERLAIVGREDIDNWIKSQK